jgi:hypothetical protein
MSSPDITQAEMDAVATVLRTTCLSIGPQIKEFERTLAAYAVLYQRDKPGFRSHPERLPRSSCAAYPGSVL